MCEIAHYDPAMFAEASDTHLQEFHYKQNETK